MKPRLRHTEVVREEAGREAGNNGGLGWNPDGGAGFTKAPLFPLLGVRGCRITRRRDPVPRPHDRLTGTLFLSRSSPRSRIQISEAFFSFNEKVRSMRRRIWWDSSQRSRVNGGNAGEKKLYSYRIGRIFAVGALEPPNLTLINQT